MKVLDGAESRVEEKYQQCLGRNLPVAGIMKPVRGALHPDTDTARTELADDLLPAPV